MESLRYDRRGNLLATYNGGVSYWNFERREEDKQELALPYSGACICGDVTPGGWAPVGGSGGRQRAMGGCLQLACVWAPVCPPMPLRCLAEPPITHHPSTPIVRRQPPADMDYIVAGCHDASVHIYHFTEKKRSGVQLHVRSSPARQPACPPARLPAGWLDAVCEGSPRSSV